MSQIEATPLAAQDITFKEYGEHVKRTNQVPGELKKLYSPMSPLQYYTGGIVEGAWEAFTGSEDEQYGRRFLPLATFAAVRQQRSRIDALFPVGLNLQLAEYGDMTWYETAAMQSMGLNLRVAVNIGTSLMHQSTTFETFGQLDEHIAANPRALSIPNRLKSKSLHPLGGDGPAPVERPDITCEDNSFMVFGELVRQLVTTLEDASQKEPQLDPDTRRMKAAEYTGQLLWCQGFVLQNHFGSSLSETVASNAKKTLRRQRNDTIFGNGDAQ